MDSANHVVELKYGMNSDVKLSVLDLASVCEGGSVAESFRNTVKLAQAVEEWGYRRFWLAEHHNMPGIASAATSVLIGHVAGATKTIRVGSGGIMLPNHAPLVIAEQFGTLEALYPTVERKLRELLRVTGADELIIYSDFYRNEDRLHSYEIVADLFLNSKIKRKWS